MQTPPRSRLTPTLWWGLGSTLLAGWFGSGFVTRTPARPLLTPAAMSPGHAQIELACEACHTQPFSNRETLQAACVGCHGAELKLANDSHPESKFTDPRNADRITTLDARYCVTCHSEHQPHKTLAMGLTQPADFCVRCHSEIGKERPTHVGLPFDSCANGGCHNFHDNRALYEDFLVKHAQAPETRPSELPQRKPLLAQVEGPLTRSAVALENLPALATPELLAWEQSAHARARVGCTDCHGETERFLARPDLPVCTTCHQRQAQGFQQGRHGMRSLQGLPNLRVKDAQLPMKPSASQRSLHCGSCHTSHGFDTRFAAAEACVNCHDDEHSRAYAQSKHAQLFRDEGSGLTPAGSGVSCATCHLPRETDRDGTVSVVHNQNHDLRPNEKMLRDVCMSCHSLAFSLDALADAELVQRNFNGRPQRHVESIDMALSRVSPSLSP